MKNRIVKNNEAVTMRGDAFIIFKEIQIII